MTKCPECSAALIFAEEICPECGFDVSDWDPTLRRAAKARPAPSDVPLATFTVPVLGGIVGALLGVCIAEVFQGARGYSLTDVLFHPFDHLGPHYVGFILAVIFLGMIGGIFGMMMDTPRSKRSLLLGASAGALLGGFVQVYLETARDASYVHTLGDMLFSPLSIFLVTIALAIVSGAIAAAIKQQHPVRKNRVLSAIAGACVGAISIGITGSVLSALLLIWTHTGFDSSGPIAFFVLVLVMTLLSLVSGAVGGAIGGMMRRPTVVALPLFCGAASVVGMSGLMALQLLWEGDSHAAFLGACVGGLVGGILGVLMEAGCFRARSSPSLPKRQLALTSQASDVR